MDKYETMIYSIKQKWGSPYPIKYEHKNDMQTHQIEGKIIYVNNKFSLDYPITWNT